MAEDSDLERTEAASPRRLEEARAKGNVPRSRELVTFMMLMAAGGGISAMSSHLLDLTTGLMRHGLQFTHAMISDPHAMGELLTRASLDALLGMLPFLLLMAAAAIIGSLALSGWLFSTDALIPNFGRLNPQQGLSRMFSVTSLAELAKSILKCLLIGGFAWGVVHHQVDALLGLATLAPRDSIYRAGSMITSTFLMISASLLILVLFDVPYQLWNYARQLRMTKEELKQESRQSEGSPEVKGRIRRMQREAARKRMMQEVPKADVIITNPTRFAVALQYNADMRAPKVLASGHLVLAQRIRELAEEHRIPILEAPPLARALYKHVLPGQEVPASLYHAVAEVMAYIYQLRRFSSEGGEAPPRPEAIQVPDGLDPEAGDAA